MKLFSTEQVSKYHPDKYADQISDAILDECLQRDANARVAVETMVKGTHVVLAGEITARITKEVIHETVKRVAEKLGYEVQYITNLITNQSPEIARAVSAQSEIGAGDQGMMVGYATRETESQLPYAFDLANRVIKIIENDVEENENTILRGDAKVQVTVEIDGNYNSSLHTLLVSACHKPGKTLAEVRDYITELLKDKGIPEAKRTLINPAGSWTIGGPIADAGLTGRKIVCDQYGGYVPVGGGAFSGKDPSKVDRSGAYAARALAKEILEKHPEINEALVQIAYAIGIPQPVSINVKTDRPEMDEAITNEIDYKDYTPRQIIKRLKLDTICYETLAERCHYYGIGR